MAKKDLTLRCTNITLRADGRQSVALLKPAASAITSTPGGSSTVNPPDAEMTLVVDAADNYMVGKDYLVSITS